MKILCSTYTAEDETAADRAMHALRRGEYSNYDLEDRIQLTVMDAVGQINEANGFAEYADEDFYMQEADYDRTLKLVKSWIDDGSFND